MRFNVKQFCSLPTLHLCLYVNLIVSLHDIHLSVFITETECVYCAVRAESLNIIRINPSFYVINT
jgi:hypothetical protein